MSRIGPSTLVVDDLLGVGEEAPACVQSSARMIPAIATSTFSVGERLDHVGGGAPRSRRRRRCRCGRSSRPCVGGELRRAASCARPPTMTVLPARLEAQREGEADAAGRAGDEDGVSGDVHASTVAARRGRRRERPGDRGIGGPWLPCAATAHRWMHMDRAALADFLRRRREALRPHDVGLVTGAATAYAGPAPRGGRRADRDVDRLLRAPRAAAWPAALRADARRARPGAAPDRRRARPPLPAGRPRRPAAHRSRTATSPRRCCACSTGSRTPRR